MRNIRLISPADFALSPHSGWTRDHWLEMYADLMVPIIDNASPGKARQLIPGQRSHHGRLADELEGFTRSFIMAGPWLSQSETPVVTSSEGTKDVAAFYREGILNGTNPKHDEYWGDITDYAQHLVEMASLAWSLFLSRRWIWDTLSSSEQRQVAEYLYSCTKVKYHQNNWLLFNVVTNSVLKRLDMPYRQEQIDQNIEACEHMYIGSGWYRDGDVNRIDYYNAWAFHYYYLIWTILDGESKPEVARKHKERVRLLAEQLPFFLSSEDGAPIFGRSMIYRFGYLAPLLLGHYLGAIDRPVGELRSLCNRSMRYFSQRPIVTDRGFLGMGYIKPNESILEHYSCGGSPYWAVKAFNALLLPREDAFWTKKELPLPIDRESYSLPIRDAGFVLVGSRDDGQVQLINQKSYHDKAEYNAKYTNFAYSTHFPYESRRIYGSVPPDNALQFSEDGILFYQRWEMEHLGVSKSSSASRYPLYTADPEGSAVSTVLIHGGVLVLIHHITPTKPLWFREGGFPLAYDGGEPLFESGSDWVAASLDGKISIMANLYGYEEITPPEAYGLETQGTNVVHPFSVIPVAKVRREQADPCIFVSMVAGTGSGLGGEQLRGVVKDLSVEGTAVSVEYADGALARVDSAAGSIAWK